MKIVKVEWLDAQTGFSTPETIEELEQEKPTCTLSVGYLITDDKDKIILGFMKWGEDDEIIKNTMFKHWQLIPKGMIKKITELKEIKK